MLKTLFLALALPALARAVDLPRKALDFTIQMNSGKPLQLSQYKGKTIVMLFILTTCPHCQKAVSCLSKDTAEFTPRGLQVLAAAVEEGAAAHVPDFIRVFKPAFPVGYTADYDAVFRFMQHSPKAVPHMPLVAFIDRTGMIRAQYEGTDAFLQDPVIEANLRKGIADLLAQPAR
ncbi:MAG TPA: TlpA disulfide reductase family protein [Verrucomicrobiae bacterium]|nr:TlpA disulfide reductase family protein [Verrucomicrobiae bacterium]